MQRDCALDGADGGAADPVAAARLQGGAPRRAAHLGVAVARQARGEGHPHLVEGRRRGRLGHGRQAHVRPEGQQAEPLPLSVHRHAGHHKEKEVRGMMGTELGGDPQERVRSQTE